MIVPFVASFTDAWIETVKGYTQIEAKVGRIFYRCVDWNYIEPEYYILRESRIFYRCVDWNKAVSVSILLTLGRIFYRCVDWNL